MKYLGGSVLCAVAVLTAMRLGPRQTSCPADFEVRLVGAPADAPAVAGRCVMVNSQPTFRPALPLLSGASYSVRAGGREIERIGSPAAIPQPSVTVRILPSADVLPANLLKLYLEFSAPVMLGESRRRIRLLDSHGGEVPNAFLSLDEEMWDPERRRLTVLFDPGRVKRGLKANLQSGTPLVEHATYALVVDQGWPDAYGAALRAGASKRFVVTGPDRRMPRSSTWRISAVSAGTRQPIALSFGEPMDYAVALRAVRILDDRGLTVDGTATLAADDAEWRFAPAQPWKGEPYTLFVDARIEDLAGNNLFRLFDLDLRTATARAPEAYRMSFTPSYSSRNTTIGSTRVARLAGM